MTRSFDNVIIKGTLWSMHKLEDVLRLPSAERPSLKRLRNAKLLSMIDDMSNGYWQIPISEDCRRYTAFQRALDSVIRYEL